MTTAQSTGVTLTEAAAAKAKALLDQEGATDLALRISVAPGGCAGLRYQLYFDDRSLDGDAMSPKFSVASSWSLIASRFHTCPVPPSTSLTPLNSRASPSITRMPLAPALAVTPSTKSLAEQSCQQTL